MPELPEVEIFKQYFDATSLHQVIEKVEVKNTLILGKVTEQELQARLPGQQFQSTRRHGKYLLAYLDGDFWFTFHFGMTGRLELIQDLASMPAHTRFLVIFGNGSHLAFQCPRMLGKVDLAEDLEMFLKDKKLGPDALAVNFSTFKKILKKRTGIAKSILMNQQVFAGIGNLYADEILFQTGVHPTTKVNTLTAPILRQMFEVMKTILQTSITSKTNFSKLPKDYLLPNRLKDGICPRCNSPVATMKSSGRTTYYCPQCQKKPF